MLTTISTPSTQEDASEQRVKEEDKASDAGTKKDRSPDQALVEITDSTSAGAVAVPLKVWSDPQDQAPTKFTSSFSSDI